MGTGPQALQCKMLRVLYWWVFILARDSELLLRRVCFEWKAEYIVTSFEISWRRLKNSEEEIVLTIDYYCPSKPSFRWSIDHRFGRWRGSSPRAPLPRSTFGRGVLLHKTHPRGKVARESESIDGGIPLRWPRRDSLQRSSQYDRRKEEGRSGCWRSMSALEAPKPPLSLPWDRWLRRPSTRTRRLPLPLRMTFKPNSRG